MKFESSIKNLYEDHSKDILKVRYVPCDILNEKANSATEQQSGLEIHPEKVVQERSSTNLSDVDLRTYSARRIKERMVYI